MQFLIPQTTLQLTTTLLKTFYNSDTPVLGDTVGSDQQKIESDGSTSGNEQNISSGYNSNDNPSHISNENIDPIQNLSFSKLKRPVSHVT